MIDENQLKRLNRLELLELLVEQGEQLERTQQALAVAEARAAHQERIARLAEDAAARLSGILEAAQLAQSQYNQNLRELKAQMGIKSETVSGDDSYGSASNYTVPSVSGGNYHYQDSSSTGYSYNTDGSYYGNYATDGSQGYTDGYSYPASTGNTIDFNSYVYQGDGTTFDTGGEPS